MLERQVNPNQEARSCGGQEGLTVLTDPENMLVMLHTWQAGDASNQEPYNGDFKLAMQGIKAKTLVLPGKTDLYFPPEDSEYEVENMREGVGKCIPFPSIWGHWYVESRQTSLIFKPLIIQYF